MKPQALVELLRQFLAGKLGLERRHEAAARLVGTYDFNNTYQYVIAREEAHLDWLRRAIQDLGGDPSIQPAALAEPHAGKSPEAQAAILADDAGLMRAFIGKWRGPADQVDDARQKLMLRVILGEMLEHQRFFEQAVAGRHDLLGRRTSPGETAGRVLADRWVE